MAIEAFDHSGTKFVYLLCNGNFAWIFAEEIVRYFCDFQSLDKVQCKTSNKVVLKAANLNSLGGRIEVVLT